MVEGGFYYSGTQNLSTGGWWLGLSQWEASVGELTPGLPLGRGLAAPAASFCTHCQTFALRAKKGFAILHLGEATAMGKKYWGS